MEDFIKIYSITLSTIQTILVIGGGFLAFIQLAEYYRLRRVQILASFNDRLAQCQKANDWIANSSHPDRKPWDELKLDVKYEFQNYIATFEDIGLARSVGIIDKDDFLRSYGGRYAKLYNSKAIDAYMTTDGYKPVNFENLIILNRDIGVDLSVDESKKTLFQLTYNFITRTMR